MRGRRATAWWTGVVVGLSWIGAGGARADWPMGRANLARTSEGGAARIDRPAVVWRHYLGGALFQEDVVAFDVDGRGARELVFVMGGALVAKSAADELRWSTAPLDLRSIAGVVDLDGDGRDELVAPSDTGRVYVIDPTNGEVRWTSPAQRVGVDPRTTGALFDVGAIRFADLDGDTRLDLYVADTQCNGVDTGGQYAWSFAAGFAAARRLYALGGHTRDYYCGVNDVIADIDGDGADEIVAIGTRFAYVYSAATGAAESVSVDVGTVPYGQAKLVVANVDADPAEEIVGFTHNDYEVERRSRRVFLLDWDAGAGQLALRWNRSVDMVGEPGSEHRFGTPTVGDLDGDGSVEVVTSFRNMGAWSTRVFDAATGAERARVATGPFHGVANLDADAALELVTGPTSAVDVLDFGGDELPAIARLASVRPIRERLAPEGVRDARSHALLALDTDGDGKLELVVERPIEPRALLALDVSTATVREVRNLPIPDGLTFDTYLVLRDATSLGLAVTRSDGYLWLLDSRFVPTNDESAMTEFGQLGLRVGGYYTGASGLGLAVPRAAALTGGAADELLVRDSRGVLSALRVDEATLVEPVEPLWSRAAARSASIADLDGDGTLEVVAALNVSGAASERVIALRGSDGSMLWEQAVGPVGSTIFHDPLVGQLTGSAALDVAVAMLDDEGNIVYDVLDGATRASAWSSPFVYPVRSSGAAASALFDRDGDGFLDVLGGFAGGAAFFDGPTGTPTPDISGGLPNARHAAHAIVTNVLGDATPEVVLAGGIGGVVVSDLGLNERWSQGTYRTDDYLRHLPVVVTCDSESRIVATRRRTPILTIWHGAGSSGSEPSIAIEIALRDGALFTELAGVPDGGGFLGNLTWSASLTADGRSGVLVPSTDGFLYAFDPCAGTLLWALELGAPVGEAIFADTNGDGDDEIVVSAADGFLYGIDRAALEAPAFVGENDGTTLATSADDDLDSLSYTGEFHANWAPVAGATQYQVAVITAAGEAITRPRFVTTSATSITVRDLPLTVGRTYRVLVQALDASGGASPATRSDGVSIEANPCASCGAGEVCRMGRCVVDACASITCAVGEVCIDGACMLTGADAGLGGADSGVAPPAPTKSSDGCGCRVAGATRRDGATSPVGLVVAALALGALLARRRVRA